jgi:ADP-L-glycero-D-manno-heptose 6-epimerase
MLLVTGGAGFIGSNLVAGLNEAGRTDIVVNDTLGDAGKWRNLAKRRLADVVPPGELMDWLDNRKLDAVIHLGAISDTTATDGDLVLSYQFSPVPQASGLMHGNAHAIHLCVLGRDLRRRCRGLR